MGTMKPRIFVTRRIPQVGLDLLQARFEVDIWEGELPPSRDVLLSRVRNAVGLLSLLSDKVDGQVMDATGGSLKAIANYAVGYNNIDVAAARERGIAVGNTPDVLTDATADIAVGLMIAAARRFQESNDQVRQLQWKTWEPLGLIGQDMTGRTLGIVGMGRIGAAVARRFVFGWGMKLVYTARTDKHLIDNDLKGRRVTMDELLSVSDFISIHTDLNAATKHLFGAEQFRAMKRNAVLVNTARGGIIDQQALYHALKDGHLFAAGLDVTDPEPLPSESPLRELSSCYILPHIGSATNDARNQMATMAAENIIAAIDGKPMPFSI